jgi:hypothetical protein
MPRAPTLPCWPTGRGQRCMYKLGLDKLVRSALPCQLFCPACMYVSALCMYILGRASDCFVPCTCWGWAAAATRM